MSDRTLKPVINLAIIGNFYISCWCFYKTFNKDFEEACKVQRGISIPDVILREGIKRDNVEHILPKYNRFYEMYASVQFSKNPDKYGKYRPHEINQMLSKLFDDSAWILSGYAVIFL